MHRDGLPIWNAIATEGATDLMVRGDAFGTNHKGHYTTDLVDFYGRARRARGDDYSLTVKLTVLLGGYLSDDYNHHYYAKAQNLGRRLKARYAEALERYDVLLLPTTAMKAKPIPVDPSHPRHPRRRARQPAQHVAVRRHRQPGAERPVRLQDGLPIGMMLVGRHFDDATVLRAGHAYLNRDSTPPRPAAGVIGSSVHAARPCAAAIALAIAGGTPQTGGSPMPLAPNGPSGAGTSTISVSIGGTGSVDGIAYSANEPPRSWPFSSWSSSSSSAQPMPCAVPPCIWPSTSAGFSALPTSWAITWPSSVTPPVSRSTRTCERCAAAPGARLTWATPP